MLFVEAFVGMISDEIDVDSDQRRRNCSELMSVQNTPSRGRQLCGSHVGTNIKKRPKPFRGIE
jgi:hypothetical protein